MSQATASTTSTVIPPPTTAATPSLYQVLGFSPDHNTSTLTTADIKTAYRRSLLAHHPDKQVDAGVKSNDLTVDAISLAYKILADPTLRAEYDQALLTTRANHGLPEKFTSYQTGLDTVDLDDLTYHDEQNIWTRSCRCGPGGGFTVHEHELEANAEDGELITGCHGCSLWIRVMYSIEE